MFSSTLMTDLEVFLYILVLRMVKLILSLLSFSMTDRQNTFCRGITHLDLYNLILKGLMSLIMFSFLKESYTFICGKNTIRGNHYLF